MCTCPTRSSARGRGAPRAGSGAGRLGRPGTAGLASRARRRVRGQAPAPDPDLARRRDIVNAFLAAARDGDFEGLVAVLHPDVVLRSDSGAARARHTVVLTGARTVAAQAITFGRLSPFARPALINGAAGVVVAAQGRPLSVMGFTVTGGKIVAIDVIAAPDRLRKLDLAVLDGGLRSVPFTGRAVRPPPAVQQPPAARNGPKPVPAIKE
jgi:hypothetical protein